MVIDASFVKRHIKPKADSTLLNMKKSDLIEYVRTLEHNYNVAVSFNEQQARNIETMMKNGDIPSKWISVEDELPNEEQLVLLLCKNGARFVGYEKYNSYEQEPRWRIKTALNSTKLLNKGKVTHWMPLPEPPKEGSKK